MDNEQLILEHLVELKSGQADLSARMSGLEKAVTGNGNPGLTQRVTDLEVSRGRLWGFGGAVAALWGAFEVAWHYFKGGGK